MCDDLTPQQRLAKIVAEETDGGRTVVRFFVQVADGELDHQGFKPNHRMDAGKELVKVGLTEFEDYIRANHAGTLRRAPRARRATPDPEMEQARQELAQYARELTDGGRTVIKLYADVMDGLLDDEGFKPHHRIAAGRELLKRGFDYECAHATPTVVPAKGDLCTTTVVPVKTGTQRRGRGVSTIGHATPTVVPAKAGTQIDTGTTRPEDYPNASEQASGESDKPVNPDSDEEPTDYLAIVKRVVESLGPVEEEEEEDTGHKPDYSMWDMIEYPPLSEISDEHAEIGAALFHEAVERDRLWKKANAKTPTRKDHDNYDDG